ncbi:MAG TPA: LysM peptidoglycan-binding domain-containing protein, partial [Chloroflexota bacterium]|nr:LysM peptidoglycan-binding domain-containing protein [Chloroflexota bacterium]
MQQRHSRLGLIGLTAGLLATGAGLWATAGPPHLPPRLPGWTELVIILQAPTLPLGAVAYVASSLAWLLWLWMVGSILLHCAVVVSEGFGTGRWVERPRRLSNRVTVPFVRRLVEGALVATFVVQLAGRTEGAMAAPPQRPLVAISAVMGQSGAGPSRAESQPASTDPNVIWYTVQPGDSLWTVARRFYGTGLEYPRLVQANQNRQMPDGGRLSQANEIFSGWVLAVPQPSSAIEEVDGQVFYTVEDGDTLSGIAARLLGDERRSPEIFELNRGKAELLDGRTLENPDLIWPGLQLQLPIKPALPSQPRPAPAAPPPPPSSPSPRPTVQPAEPTPLATELPRTVATPKPQERGQLVAFPELAGAAAVAGAAVAGAVALRRRRLRSQQRGEAEDVPIQEGFAEAQPGRVLSHQLQGGEPDPVAVVAMEVQRFLAERAIHDVQVLWVRDGRKTTGVALAATSARRGELLDLASDFGRLLGGAAEARSLPGDDVEWRLSGIRWLGMASAKVPASLGPLLPVAVLPNQDILYANWHAMGQVLVASLANGGADTIVTSLVASVTARLRPDELRVWTLARPHTLPPELGRLPHQLAGMVDSGDASMVSSVLDTVRAEVSQRLRHAAAAGDDSAPAAAVKQQPEWLLVIGDLADLHGHETTLDVIATKGRECGVRLLAGLAPPFDPSVVQLFPTRLTLRLTEEADSVQLLGDVQAADLGGGGHLLVSIDRRPVLQGRGFRVAPEDMNDLVRAMADAYGQSHSPANDSEIASKMEHPEPLTPAGELLSANVEQPPRDQSESTEASQAGAPGQGSDSRESDQRT